MENFDGYMFSMFLCHFFSYIQWADDTERLCAVETPFMVEMISPRAGLEPVTARSHFPRSTMIRVV